MGIKQLRQDKADNDATQAALRAELNDLLNVARADRTPEQAARMTAINTESVTLANEAKAIASELATAERLAAAERAEGERMPRLEVGRDLAETKPVTMGEWLQGVAYAAMPGKRDLIPAHVKAELFAASGASSGVSADGGFLVRNEWNTSLMNQAQTASQILGKCDQLPIGDGFDGIEAPYVNETSRATGSRWGGVQVYRAAEAATVTASKPSLGKFELRLEDMKGLFYATDRVLRDATLLEALANRAFSSEFAFKIDDEILRGTGAGQCLGVIGADCTVTPPTRSRPRTSSRCTRACWPATWARPSGSSTRSACRSCRR